MTAAYLKSKSVLARREITAEHVRDDHVYVYDVNTGQIVVEFTAPDKFGQLMLRSGKGAKPTQAVVDGAELKKLMDLNKFWKVV